MSKFKGISDEGFTRLASVLKNAGAWDKVKDVAKNVGQWFDEGAETRDEPGPFSGMFDRLDPQEEPEEEEVVAEE